jgi:hypothetical protein
MATAIEVAQWMVDRIRATKAEYQEHLVSDIETRFGSEWIYYNDSGNPAISKKVLAQFRKLHAGSIDWENGDKRWTV